MNTRDLMNTDDAYHYGMDFSKIVLKPARKREEDSHGCKERKPKAGRKRYICIDLEMTDFSGTQKGIMSGTRGEVIQFGAVMLDENYNLISKFSSYVKPAFSSVTPFIEDLTGITNEMLENADDFITVLDKFSYWRGEGDVTTYTWSKADHNQLWQELSVKGKHREDLFLVLKDFLDLQKIFKNLFRSRTCVSLDSAVRLLQMSFDGQMHSAYSDAYNTARILHKLFCTEGLELEVDYINPGKSHMRKAKKTRGQEYGCSFASFLSPELLAQFGYSEAEEEEETPEVVEEPEENELWQVDSEALKNSPLAGLVDEQEISELCRKYCIESERWLRLASELHATGEMAVA